MAIAELERARTSLADEWRERNPQTPEEVAVFYREADGLRADLNAWHELPSRQEWTRILVGAAKAVVNPDGTRGARSVLDVGAGTGADLSAVREALPDAYLYAVEPNADLRRGLHHPGPCNIALSSIDLMDSSVMLEPFDLISCLDVLEHVPDPDGLLQAIVDRLRMGGIFVEATATHDMGTPLHLPHLRGWSPGRVLDRHGFILREQIDRVRIWQRVAETRAAVEHLLLCAYRTLTVETAEVLSQLVALGWRHNIHRGDALISRVRSIATSQWLRETDGDVFLMIDDDIVFQPEDAQKIVALAREKRGIACAAYPVRGGTHLACRALDSNVVFGPDLPPVEIQYAATGFMAAHRDVCEAVITEHKLPLCHPDQTWAFWPLFQPLILTTPDADGHDVAEYLSEDWSFCFRARQAGFGVWLDPSIELTHLGQAAYTVKTMQGAQPEPVGTDAHG